MRLFPALLLALTLAACGPTEGTLIDKQYYPDHVDLIPMYNSCGNGCSYMTIIPVYTPPCWEIFLRNGDETGDHCIDHDVWLGLRIGQYYKMPD